MGLYRVAMLQTKGLDKSELSLEAAICYIEGWHRYYSSRPNGGQVIAELFRDGRPILGFTDGMWHALGDDYLDPPDLDTSDIPEAVESGGEESGMGDTYVVHIPQECPQGMTTHFLDSSAFGKPRKEMEDYVVTAPPTERMIHTSRDTLPYWNDVPVWGCE